MNKLKSQVLFSKKQRFGIFLLVLIIVLVQVLFFHLNKPSDNPVSELEYVSALKEIDSIEKTLKEKKLKVYPFNPNYITDYKGYTLGMSVQEIDRLLAFREQNKWVNSAKEFQSVTKVSDSLLNIISPYFKFPDWVTNPKKSNFKKGLFKKKSIPKFDLNTATKSQLTSIYGIGDFYAAKIIALREKSNGFASYVELSSIYKIKPETILKIKEATIIKTPRVIKRYNINKITRSELVSIPNIDYELAFHILEYRTLNEGFKTLDELLKVYDFPASKFEIIKLYLFIE